MSTKSPNKYPALHNAMWPGLVGKGGPDTEPAIDLETMLDLTAAAEVEGIGFDGVDLFLFRPHVDIDSTDDDVKRLTDGIASRNLLIGSLVAPVWLPTGGGSAMGSDEDRKKFLTQVRKACSIGQKLRNLGIRRYGVVRIDSAASTAEWPRISASDWRPKAKSAGAACTAGSAWRNCSKWWGGRRSWDFRPIWPIRFCSH